MKLIIFLGVVAPILVAFLAAGSAATLVGAPVDADLSDSGVKNALDFAVSEHNKATNDMYLSKVSRVISVKKQVVSGINYIFTIEMVRTTCRKSGVKEQQCAVQSNSQPKVCKMVVYDQPWTHTIKLTQNTCP